MAIAAIRAPERTLDSVDYKFASVANGGLNTMVTRFLESLQPGKREVEELYQRFLHAAHQAASQIRENEERRRFSSSSEGQNVSV